MNPAFRPPPDYTRREVEAVTGQTGWHCETCGKRGVITYGKHAGIWEVLNQISDAHFETSPDCETGLSKIRVSLVDQDEALT